MELHFRPGKRFPGLFLTPRLWIRVGIQICILYPQAARPDRADKPLQFNGFRHTVRRARATTHCLFLPSPCLTFVIQSEGQTSPTRAGGSSLSYHYIPLPV